MQRISVICVGNVKEEYLRKGLAEYAARLTPLCRFTVTEVAESRLPRDPSGGEIAAALKSEGERILAAVPDGSDVVALCVEGEQMSSEELAAYTEKSALSGKNGICFIIGGSFGLSPQVKKRADRLLSFGKMTFPHQLFRLMLTEQIYRAYMIRTGAKYHK